jgi:hypothetical protein
MQIKVTVPKERNEKWQVSIGRANYKKRDATAAFRIVEKKLKSKEVKKLATSNDTKTQGSNKNNQFYIFIDYSQLHKAKRGEWTNDANCQTTTSALFTLATFLEDYLPVILRREKEKVYGKGVMIHE